MEETKEIRYESMDIDLVQRQFISKEEAYDSIPTVYYDIVLHKTNTIVGDIDLRLVMNDYMYYYGHIGYNIKEQYRGNHYALKACEIIKIIAKDIYHLDELIITCDPKNKASYKTLEKLGCQYLGTENVPISHVLFWKGEKRKAIFKLSI